MIWGPSRNRSVRQVFPMAPFDPTSPTNPSTPSDAGPWVGRVQALLAKAESTPFPEEAEALLAKAQQLMARHAIDAAALASHRGGGDDAVESRRLLVDAPYASAKSTLLGAVAEANRCRCVGVGGRGASSTCVLVGYRSDLANVEVLYAALSLHAVRTMLATGVPAGDSARAFRHAYLVAFAGRIHERLRAAGAAARREAAAEAGGDSALVPVLRQRDAAVEAALKAEFPRLRTVRASSSSMAGVASGRRAADTAGLGSAPLTPGRRRALPSG